MARLNLRRRLRWYLLLLSSLSTRFSSPWFTIVLPVRYERLLGSQRLWYFQLSTIGPTSDSTMHEILW